MDTKKTGAYLAALRKARGMTQQEAADQLKRWLIELGHWLDNNIHTLQQYCHESRNKNYAY